MTGREGSRLSAEVAATRKTGGGDFSGQTGSFPSRPVISAPYLHTMLMILPGT